MEIKIFDVSHGFCALITADNGNRMMIDCGSNAETGFLPSRHLRAIGCTKIDRLLIQNYDQDHLSDLPGVCDQLHISVLTRNPSVTPEILQRMKLESGPLTVAMSRMIGLMSGYNSDVVEWPSFPGIDVFTYFHAYPRFNDTNNLSLLTFVRCAGARVAFTGDLERAGWLAHIENPDVRTRLRDTNIFVASHHGRESGYCRDVFDYCSPSVILISDKEVVHETQRHNYSSHATGISWNGVPNGRYVLTTRNDGALSITNQGASFWISAGS